MGHAACLANSGSWLMLFAGRHQDFEFFLRPPSLLQFPHVDDAVLTQPLPLCTLVPTIGWLGSFTSQLLLLEWVTLLDEVLQNHSSPDAFRRVLSIHRTTTCPCHTSHGKLATVYFLQFFPPCQVGTGEDISKPVHA